MARPIEFSCPAAARFAPADNDLPGCVCGVISESNRGEEIGGWAARGEVAAALHPREDSGSLGAFCAGRYQQCPVWRAEKERLWAGRPVRGGLHAPQHRARSGGAGEALDLMMAGSRLAA